MLNAAKFGLRPSLKCRTVTLPKYESARLGGCTLNFAPRKIPQRGKNPQKCICSVPAQETAKHRAVWLASVARSHCSNADKTRNPLKFAGLPQTTGLISAASGPKFVILWRHLEDILLLNKFFPIADICLSCEDIARQSCAKLYNGA